MGIGGHILGEKKLRQLNNRTGMTFDRAYIRNKQAEGRVIHHLHNGTPYCLHYDVDVNTGATHLITTPMHWTSCPREN